MTWFCNCLCSYLLKINRHAFSVSFTCNIFLSLLFHKWSQTSAIRTGTLWTLRSNLLAVHVMNAFSLPNWQFESRLCLLQDCRLYSYYSSRACSTALWAREAQRMLMFTVWHDNCVPVLFAIFPLQTPSLPFDSPLISVRLSWQWWY